MTASAAASKAGSQIIFDSALENGWGNQSWAKFDFNNTSPVHGGTKSIKITVARGYDALSLRHAPFKGSTFAFLSFWINGGPTGGQQLRVFAVANGKPLNLNPNPLPVLNKNSWEHVVIPLSALDVTKASVIDSFWISDMSGHPSPPFFVSDITLTDDRRG